MQKENKRSLLQSDKKIKLPQKGIKIKINLVKVGIFFLVFLTLLPFLLAFFETKIEDSQISLTRGLQDLKDGKVDRVVVQNDKLTFEYKDGGVKSTTKESNISFVEMLDKAHIDPSKVDYKVADQTVSNAIGNIAGIVLPVLLTGAAIFFLIRMQSRGAQDIFSFGRSKAKLFAKGKQDVTFADVAGVDEAKKELEEIVDFLKHPA